MSGRYLPKAASLRAAAAAAAAGLATDVVQQLIAASANRLRRKFRVIIFLVVRWVSGVWQKQEKPVVKNENENYKNPIWRADDATTHIHTHEIVRKSPGENLAGIHQTTTGNVGLDC